MTITMMSMVARILAAIKMALAVLAPVLLGACNPFGDYSYLETASIKSWFNDNKGELSALATKMDINNFVGDLGFCAEQDGQVSSSKGVNDNYLSELSKIASPLSDGCLHFHASRPGSDANKRLISVSLDFILEGGCIPSGGCKRTVVIYYPNESLGGVYSKINDSKFDYEKLSQDGWYILRW